MPKALIADDEPHLAAYLRKQLEALWPELEIVHVARNGLEAAERIAALDPDLAFLDIEMPGLSGLEVAQGIEGRTRVVFVTAYDEYALKAFDAEAIDYVLKPVSAERLSRSVERIRRTFGAADEPGRLAAAIGAAQRGSTAGGLTDRTSPPLRWIRAGGAGDMTHQIDVADVLFFQSDEKYTVVRTAAAEHLIRMPIAELAAQLDPRQFSQVHRSTIVNLAHLAGTRRDDASRLWLRIHGHAAELPVSRAYVHLFKAM